jgi:DnaJ-class molecular chaperone
MHAEVCPVCRGRGVKPASFYHPGLGLTVDVTCRSCHGLGYVWLPDAETMPRPFDPRMEFKVGEHGHG